MMYTILVIASITLGFLYFRRSSSFQGDASYVNGVVQTLWWGIQVQPPGIPSPCGSHLPFIQASVNNVRNTVKEDIREHLFDIHFLSCLLTFLMVKMSGLKFLILIS